ncbi:uncharacterized protein PITG_11427 [Phytophthora infestans T30-4]|uniref:PH domain-containing protein n=1 Tax=Phytophthora infestans (strain T30-4) TaxID=403677 RepID=D0NIR5_PHYIT|nr:uncharacterized protein PITG_11427 [Phytophthora infestans T30-4]EEY59399.1 conserved hypothetical protein [Phytophthora infestans T30-4]|eukprot:XP_002901009.1 conserved hypothetical protein [Phytophthora infestans T30-4]
MSSTAESFDFRLKRKVRNAETKLFEWRPCSCTIVAQDGNLLLQLQSPPRDEESQDEIDNEMEIITIDLATQLVNVVPKKNKARCNLEYYSLPSTRSEGVLKEELMAPSGAHCQQWMAQVRRVQQQAHQHRRPTSSSSTRSGASPVAPLLSPLTNSQASISSISSVSTTIPPTTEWRRRSGTRISTPEYQYSSSSDSDTHQHSTRCSQGESSQAELHILQRVEAALRALEVENAQAKTRERDLLQEIQTLRDAARVAAAERKHTEHEYRHARRKAESWRRAAQSAEAAAAQLQEQLGVAREENQLLAGDKLRLKRQNNELLTQVHRLDSLVYGRF